MGQKNILFISPVMPSLEGRGRNFRAYQWIWRLQNKYRVSVLCTSVYGAKEYENDASIKKLDCEIFRSSHAYSTFHRISNLLSFKPSTWNAIGDIVKKEIAQQIHRPDVILCFRIQNASTALYSRRFWQTQEIWLDIDEVDSKVKYSIAKRMWLERYYVKAAKEWMEATFYSIQESRLIPEFNKIIASTVDEEEYLQNLNITKQTEVFRNMLPILKNDKSNDPDKTPFTFIFVGDSNYFPNLDAINFLLFDIIPGLKKETEIPFMFIIIGGDVGARQLQQIEKYDCITFFHDTDDLKLIYDQANAVIVPLRAGGGSSLKFLEALRYKKPVITTSIGARGFDVQHGIQALIGEDSVSIIEHCQSLMNNKTIARDLSKNGHQWFVDHGSYKIDEFEYV